jgi:putative ABC transport system ATP-binding protein
VSIRAQSVAKHFSQGGARIDVLRSVDLSVETGETVAILGESGSGKSTLLTLLAGLDVPDSGTIEVDGQPLERLDEKARTAFRGRSIGIVFQQFHLMSTLNALENVRLPLDVAGAPDAEERARAALAAVGLAPRETHLPRALSGGECQRVAIARALVVRPRVLLADEPSGSLDTRTGAAITELLFSLVESARTTMLLVTHSEALAQRCRRRFRLAEGRLEVLP